MTTLDSNPSDRNFLSPIGFKFQIKRAPNVNFFIQKVNLPGMSSPAANDGNPMVNIPWPGDHVDFEKLSVEFKVDENLANYLEIHNWLRSVSLGSDLEGYSKLSKVSQYAGYGVKSEIILSILTSDKVPNFHVVFHEAFPSSLGGIQFDASADSVDYPLVTATFEYQMYTIEQLA